MSNTLQPKRGFFRNAFDAWVAARERQAERYVRYVRIDIESGRGRGDR